MAANNTQDLALLEEVVAKAGLIAMKYFKSENEVWMKPGDSPVSRADMEVNKFLQENLLAARPDYGWLSEESEDTDKRMSQDRVFVVDPIDGTRGFINGSDLWCISVAIVEAGRPVAAILECPALGERYCATSDGNSLLNGKTLAAPHCVELKRATGSKKINALLEDAPGDEISATPFIPSLAYRIAMVATGRVDVAYARPGAHDWDIAAADLIITNAGAELVDTNGDQLRYNRKNLRREALIACPAGLLNPAIKLAKSAGILH